MKNTSSFKIIMVATLILMSVAFYNGYPLVYSDTGTYINSGFEKIIPLDRPIAYGLFVKLFSMKYSLWFVAFFQNFITALVLFELLKTFNVVKAKFNFFYLSIILFLTFSSGLAWYSNQIMPDFFAPICVVLVYLLLVRKNLSKWLTVMFSLLLVFGLISHFSHLMIVSFLVIFIGVLKFLFKKDFLEVGVKRLMMISLVVFSGWLVLPTVNYVFERKFILSKSSHVFIMAHLNDTGILKSFLDENCSSSEYENCKLCLYKDSLPPNLSSFLWSSGILEKTGGWENSEEEYNKIINGTLVRFKYFSLNVFKSTSYGFSQLAMTNIGQGLSSYRAGSPPYDQVHWRFNHEMNNYLNSKQNIWAGNNLKLEFLNLVQTIVIIISLFFTIYFFSSSIRHFLSRETKSFLIFMLVTIIVNSFVTAGLTAPCDRFQARVVWLLPLAIIVLIVKNKNVILKNIGSNFTNKSS